MPKLFLYISCILLFLSCNNNKGNIDKDKSPLIAELYGKKLYLSEIENMINTSSPQDSIKVLKGLVMNWVTDQLLIKEAEANMPSDIEIEKLLEEYKSSLMRYNYETKLASELLDTFISDTQKEQYYNAHKAEYELVEPILKYRFAKISKKAENLDEFYKKWKSDNELNYIVDFCKKNADYFEVDDNRWIPLSDLESKLPSKLFSKDLLDNEESVRKKEGDFEYFIKVDEFVKEDENPPYEYIQFKIEKVLLNERKRDLIQNKKAQLYAKDGDKAKIYVN
jgi:hypothetical protein